MRPNTDFSSLGLKPPLLKVLEERGYEYPTPVQAMAIPLILAGRDIKASAKTGTGKTAAFALPIIQALGTSGARAAPGRPLALVLVPTRELAAQVGDSFRAYGAKTSLRCAVAFDGVGKAPQAAALEAGADILVATPGRLLDLVADGAAFLDSVVVFVLDEADRMLDMGFINDMRKIFKMLPADRQTLLFSATLPAEVEEIAAGILRSPERVAADPPSAPADGIDQRIYYIEKERKRALLLHLLSAGGVDRALVFTRTRHLANRLARHLNQAGIAAEALHSDKSQGRRLKVLAAFKEGSIRVLVATDLAARGLDIDELPHVINMEIPNESQTYVHRIGRTARAGSRGTALSFCCPDEEAFVKDIESLIGARIAELPVPEGIPYPPPREEAEPRSQAGTSVGSTADARPQDRRPREGAQAFARAQDGQALDRGGPDEVRRPKKKRRRSRKGQAKEGQAERGQRPGDVRSERRQDLSADSQGRGRLREGREDVQPCQNAGSQKERQPKPQRPGQGRDQRGDRQPRSFEGTVGRERQGQRGPRDRDGNRPAQRWNDERSKGRAPQGHKASHDTQPRQPLSDEEAWLKAQRDMNQPGIRPPEDGRFR